MKPLNGIFTDENVHDYKRWNKFILLKELSTMFISRHIKFKIYGIRTDKNTGADLLSMFVNNNDKIEQFKKWYYNDYSKTLKFYN